MQFYKVILLTILSSCTFHLEGATKTDRRATALTPFFNMPRVIRRIILDYFFSRTVVRVDEPLPPHLVCCILISPNKRYIMHRKSTFNFDVYDRSEKRDILEFLPYSSDDRSETNRYAWSPDSEHFVFINSEWGAAISRNYSSIYRLMKCNVKKKNKPIFGIFSPIIRSMLYGHSMATI